MSDVIHLCVILHIRLGQRWEWTASPMGSDKKEKLLSSTDRFEWCKAGQGLFLFCFFFGCSVKFKAKKEFKLNLWQTLLLKRPPISKKCCSPGDFAYIFNANSCQYWHYVLTVRGIKMILSTWGDSIDTSDYA